MESLESSREELDMAVVGKPTPTNSEDVEITIREVKDKLGKPILVVFDDVRVLSDIRCMDKDSIVCDTCSIKFWCFTNLNLEIDFKKDLKSNSIDTFRITLNTAVESYLVRQKGK